MSIRSCSVRSCKPNRRLETMRRINCKSPVWICHISKSMCLQKANTLPKYWMISFLIESTTYVYKSYNILLGWHWKARAFITANWFPMDWSNGEGLGHPCNGISVPLVHCSCLRLTLEPRFTVFASLRMFLMTFTYLSNTFSDVTNTFNGFETNASRLQMFMLPVWVCEFSFLYIFVNLVNEIYNRFCIEISIICWIL